MGAKGCSMLNGSARYVRLLLLAAALAALVVYLLMTAQALRSGETRDTTMVRTGVLFLLICAVLGWRGLAPRK